MSTKDLGTHSAELHGQGMLTIKGEDTSVTLPAHEALELLKWLSPQRKKLTQAVHSRPEQDLPDWLHSITDAANSEPGERETPVDEP